MKIFNLLASVAFCAMAGVVAAQGVYTFDHGPYLQGLTTTEATIFFTTSDRGFSYVEARPKGSENILRFKTVHAGLIEAFDTMNAIRIGGLAPATEYEYRLVSKKIADFQPYHVTYGDSIASPWYGFRTIDPDAKTFSFVIVSDIHDDADKYRKLLSYMPMDSVQMVFLNGDLINFFQSADQPYASFIDPSVELFATSKPFVVVRGNHETRGQLARQYHQYVYLPGGHFYGLYRIGDTAVIMLDCGEDKPDDHPVYAGLVSFDDYRREQADWLREIVVSPEFTSAQHRIVIVHIPPIDSRNEDGSLSRPTRHGNQQVYDLFLPILNSAGADLMICGHMHRQMFLEKESGVYEFPVVVNDNKSASFVHVSPDGIRLRTIDTAGKTTLERVF